MNALSKGIAVAAIHILMVLSLGGKLLYDRATRPRLWVQTSSVDPDLPIRGRYITLGLQVHVPEYQPDTRPGPQKYIYQQEFVKLSVENGQLTARKSESPTGLTIVSWGRQMNQAVNDIFVLSPNVDFFVPEHADVPALRRGDQMWAEVTIPRKGPPRPIQLAIKRGTEWIPLHYR